MGQLTILWPACIIGPSQKTRDESPDQQQFEYSIGLGCYCSSIIAVYLSAFEEKH